MINVAVIGYGYWGPRVTRNFQSSSDMHLSAICDQRPEALRIASKDYPEVPMLTDPHEALTSPDIDAVAIVTPVWTHFDFAKLALQNGKHIWVEKPFTLTSNQATELIELAEQKHLHDYGGSHVSVHRRGQEDSRAHRRSDARQPLLLRLHQSQPWPVSARCQRPLGSCSARPVDYGFSYPRGAGSHRGHRAKPPQRSRRHGLHDRLLPAQTHRSL